MIAALRQQFSRKRDRNRPPAAERGQVQPARDIGGGGERPLHMPQQIGNHFRRDAQLAVGKVLDEDGAEKRVIGRADTDGKGSTQTRSEVVEQDGPRPGRLPGGDQKAASAGLLPEVSVAAGSTTRTIRRTFDGLKWKV